MVLKNEAKLTQVGVLFGYFGTIYAIWLDGQPIVDNVPLLSTGGHVGLTSSQSRVAFPAVEIFSLADTAPGPGTDVTAEQYTLSVNITLPTEPDVADAGGGVIFNMPNREDTRHASMVRLAEGGQAIFWGQYDNDGQFTGLGDAQLDLPAGEPATLTLTVRRDSSDVQVNGESVLIPASSGTSSIIRYALILFPVFMILGWWGKWGTLDRALLISISVLLGLCTAMFANWVFLA